MLTKTALDKLAEKLAEELDFEELAELSRLCGGAYGPGAFVDSEAERDPITACGQDYAGTCEQPNPFDPRVCWSEDRFDWGGCVFASPNHLPGIIVVNGSCPDPKNGVFHCDSPGGFSCTADGDDQYSCVLGADFECPIKFACYQGYNCPVTFTCDGDNGGTFGCAEGHDCPQQFTCPNTNTCGEGLEGGDSFDCGDGLKEQYGCGKTNEGESGDFHCRDNHTCKGEFTCWNSQSCGKNEQAVDQFDCGREGENPPSGSFACMHVNECSDQFNCWMSHTCNGSGIEDHFTCGNGAEIDKYHCGHTHSCTNRFDCRDIHECDDFFDCGGEQTDIYTCGNGEPSDSFSCGDDDDNDDEFTCAVGVFTCNPFDNFSCVDKFQCLYDNFQCPSDFRCAGAEAFICWAAPPNGFHCAEGEGGLFQCADSGEGIYDFMCAPDGAGNIGKFECSSTEFSCSAQHIFKCGFIGSKFECERFTCKPAGTCGIVEHPYSCGGHPVYSLPGDFVCDTEFKCTQSVECDPGSAGGDFQCHDGAGNPGFNCPEYSCGNDQHCYTADGGQGDYCTAGGLKFSCRQTGSGVACSEETNHFACRDSRYYCRSVYDCSQEGYRCVQAPGQVFHCEGDFTCDEIEGGFSNPSSHEGLPGFSESTRAVGNIGSAIVTLRCLQQHIARCNQITEQEALHLITDRLARYFAIADYGDPSRPLCELGIDVEKLLAKLGMKTIHNGVVQVAS